MFRSRSRTGSRHPAPNTGTATAYTDPNPNAATGTDTNPDAHAHADRYSNANSDASTTGCAALSGLSGSIHGWHFYSHPDPARAGGYGSSGAKTDCRVGTAKKSAGADGADL